MPTYSVTNHALQFGTTAPTVFKWPGASVPTPTANGIDVITALYDGTSLLANAMLNMR